MKIAKGSSFARKKLPSYGVQSVCAFVLIALALKLNGYDADIFKKMLLVATLALSFNFLYGIAGQIAFSHVAFYGVGAFAVTILAVSFGLPVWLSVIITLVLCVIVAIVVAVPTTRLEGFYLSLGTVAFAQLFQVLLVQGGDLTGGPSGLYGFNSPKVFGFAIAGRPYALVIVALFLLTYRVLVRLDRSWFGRACRAVQDNPQAATAMGIDVARTKLLAFVITSVLAGVAGIVYAFLDNYVSPYVFNLDLMFEILFMVIIGGAGRHMGAIIGAFVLFLAPELLGGLGAHYLLFYGLLMVVCIMFAPRGLIGLFDRFGVKLP
jgi:branched-chain amino acid transport system permease protein